MKHVRPLPLSALVVVAAMSLSCCGNPVSAPQRGYPQEIASLVSHVPGQVVTPKSEIRVRFVDPVSSAGLSGTLLPDVTCSFRPRLRATARWEDSRTLVFTPTRPLRRDVAYSGTLDLRKLLGRDLPSLSFSFRVPRVDLVSLSGRFVSLDADSSSLAYRGRLLLSEPIERDRLAAAVTLRVGGRRQRLEWDGPLAGTAEYSFQSPALARGEKPLEVDIRVAGRSLGLAEDRALLVTLEARERFSLAGVEALREKKQQGFRLDFSDPLDPRQSLEGLVQIQPEANATFRRAGSSLYLLGDFTPGARYTVRLDSHLRSDLGREAGETREVELTAADMEPAIAFLSSGVFLPSSNGQKLGFKSVNLRRIRATVMRVFENNIGQFLQTESLAPNASRTESFNGWETQRVGVVIAEETFEVGERSNTWVVSALDLDRVFARESKGLYLVTLGYAEEDIITSPPDHEYYQWQSEVYKPVIATDIGLTYKHASGTALVYATDLVNARPLPGVAVTLKSYQNQTLAAGTTDARGFVQFEDVADGVFFVVGERGDQRGIIKLNEMAWDLAAFDTGGQEVTGDGTRAFIYTERGVYRPGDEVNLSLVVRNRDDSFPQDHPLTFRLWNPRGQKVIERVGTAGRDGFTTFTFSTSPDDPTGSWRVELVAGSRTFTHEIRVETVVPFRLKVLVEPDRPALGPLDRSLDFNLKSSYLFGAPAAELSAEVFVTLKSVVKTFQKFPGYVFANEALDYESSRTQVYAGLLDVQGTARIRWGLPSLGGTPSALEAEISARVLEKGGRPNLRNLAVPIDPFDRYVGLRRPDLSWGYARTGTALAIGAVLVDAKGNVSLGRQLDYRIYKNTTYWWWEFENRQDYRLHFKSDKSTRLVAQGRVNSALTPAVVSFTPDEWGEYLVEVTDSARGGHTAAFFFSASFWGDTPAGASDAAVLALKTDKTVYAPGEVARVTFPRPREGLLLLTVEGSRGIARHELIELSGTAETGELTIQATSEMIPNAYVSLSLIQPHRQTANDRPIRLFGVIPLRVEDPRSRQEIVVTTPEVIRPNRPFTVDVRTGDGAPTQLTLAVVDEGLLDLTAFRTPDPWLSFNAKQRLSVATYDVFSHVIGANSGDFLRVFSVGGDYDQGLYTGGDREAARFKAVSLFTGPIATDARGRASVTFAMPNYMGSVRVMAVSAAGPRYGSAERTVPVKEDLLVLPSLPRVLGPEEEITVPVTVFALRDGLGDVEVTLTATSPLEIVGARRMTLTFTEIGEQDAFFQLRARAEVGTAHVTIRATAGSLSFSAEEDLPVRASSPRVSERQEVTVERGRSARLTVPSKGLRGTNEATLRVSRLEELSIDHRLRYLVTYPYGCIEQTTSAVFPQLHLKTLTKKPGASAADVDRNVNAAIERMRSFQLASGAFAFWPGGTSPSDWGTNYAGHFLLEARQLGYHVPPDMLRNWVRYQSSRALTTSGELMERVYRVMLLSLAGEPSVAGMNFLKENSLKDMNDTMKWTLAAAYRLRGMDAAAAEVLRSAGTKAVDYLDYGSSYGSKLRDQAMILEKLVLFQRWPEARDLFREIGTELAGTDWFSTQSLGYALLALGKYVGALTEGPDVPMMQGRIQLPGGQSVSFTTRDVSITETITAGFGDALTVALDAASTAQRAYVTLEWSGIPPRAESLDTKRNLDLAVRWIDEDGKPIDPSTIEQGTTFWGELTVSKTLRRAITEVALVQILPSGWEIENLRLTGEELPKFLQGANDAEYTDVRDDRVMWFFDMASSRSSYRFAVKLNAVTVGRFDLPPSLCEAMYDNSFLAVKAGRQVRVVAKQ